MMVQPKLIADKEILIMLEGNNSQGWEHLYNKYAPIMFGAIFRITDNRKLADEILIQSFIQLKKNNLLCETKKLLTVYLLQHTYATMLKILSANKITPKTSTILNGRFPIMNSVLYMPYQQRIAGINGIIKEDATRSLRTELNQIRREYQQKQKEIFVT